MNLSAITMAMNVSNVNSDIGVAVLGKNLDTLEQTGAGIQKIMNLLSIRILVRILLFCINEATFCQIMHFCSIQIYSDY